MPTVTKIFPVFLVSELERSIAYYRDTLGFSVAWTWGEPATRVGVALGDIQIQLDSVGAGAPPEPSVVYCHMEGIEDYFEFCKRNGARFSLELGLRPWGMKDFRVIDPDENRIGFGSTV